VSLSAPSSSADRDDAPRRSRSRSAGGIAYKFLPVSPLPQVEFPTINVQAACPARRPTRWLFRSRPPLERQFGRIAGVTEMTSSSSLGSTNITIQFDLDRTSTRPARDVQAAINAARGQLPANLPNNPCVPEGQPADAPI
jgi:multidrug efflux pump